MPMLQQSPRPARVIRRRLGLSGSFFAVSFYCGALTPSLLPRSWLLQGVVSGLAAAIVVVAWQMALRH